MGNVCILDDSNIHGLKDKMMLVPSNQSLDLGKSFAPPHKPSCEYQMYPMRSFNTRRYK
jgi:hypothetical protein